MGGRGEREGGGEGGRREGEGGGEGGREGGDLKGLDCRRQQSLRNQKAASRPQCSACIHFQLGIPMYGGMRTETKILHKVMKTGKEIFHSVFNRVEST